MLRLLFFAVARVLSGLASGPRVHAKKYSARRIRCATRSPLSVLPIDLFLSAASPLSSAVFYGPARKSIATQNLLQRASLLLPRFSCLSLEPGRRIQWLCKPSAAPVLLLAKFQSWLYFVAVFVTSIQNFPFDVPQQNMALAVGISIRTSVKALSAAFV